MIFLVEFIDQAIKWIKETIINPFSSWIEGLIPALSGYGAYVFYGLVGLVVLIILLIIIISVSKSKKKKKLIKQAQETIEKSETLVELNEKEEDKEEIQETDDKKTDDKETDDKEEKEEVTNEVTSNQEEPVDETSVDEHPSEEVPVEEETKEEPIKETQKVDQKKETDDIVPTPEEIALAREMVKQVNEMTTKTNAKAKKEPIKEPVKEPEKKAVSKKKVEEKSAKRSREKTGPKEVDLDFTPDRVIPEVPVEEPVKEEAIKEEPKVVEAPVKKAVPKKAKKEETAPNVSSTEEKKGAQGKFILVREGETNWRYKLKASNGEILIVSEPYTSEKSVRNGIETLKKNPDNLKIDFVEDKHGLFYFMILTKQGRCLATSASYKTKASAMSASKSYNRWATTDIVIASDEDSEHSEVEEIKIEIEEVNTGKFVIQKEGDGFIYQLLAANGVVVATSQIYKSKDSCIEACETFRRCVYKGSFFISKDKNDLYQFKLYNKQNRLVLAGEVYKERSRAISVIETIKKLARLASLTDNTNQ